MRKILSSVACGLILAAGSLGVANATPNASAIKFCEEAYKNGWTLTNEQVAQCQSASNNKHEEPVAATNPGGNQPPGQQP